MKRDANGMSRTQRRRLAQKRKRQERSASLQKQLKAAKSTSAAAAAAADAEAMEEVHVIEGERPGTSSDVPSSKHDTNPAKSDPPSQEIRTKQARTQASPKPVPQTAAVRKEKAWTTVSHRDRKFKASLRGHKNPPRSGSRGQAYPKRGRKSRRGRGRGQAGARPSSTGRGSRQTSARGKKRDSIEPASSPRDEARHAWKGKYTRPHKLAGLRFVSSSPAATAVAMDAEASSAMPPLKSERGDWPLLAKNFRLANMDPLNRGALEAGIRASTLVAEEKARVLALESKNLAAAMSESEKVRKVTAALARITKPPDLLALRRIRFHSSCAAATVAAMDAEAEHLPPPNQSAALTFWHVASKSWRTSQWSPCYAEGCPCTASWDGLTQQPLLPDMQAWANLRGGLPPGAVH